MTFFTDEYLKFLRELSANNDREWFNANKKRYVEHVKEPFEAFVAKMIDEVHALDHNVLITPKEALFRIYRDTRFSKDKTPYKTHMSAVVSQGGRKNMQSPGLYIQLGAEDARVYCGAYQVDKNGLQNIREAIASDLEGFEKMINDKNFKKRFGEIHGEKNKRIPKEFVEPAEQQPLIYNKQFYYFATFDAEIVTDKKLVKTLLDHFKAAMPMNNWLWNAIKG